MTDAGTETELLAALEALASDVAERAAGAEANRRLDPGVADRIAAAGLYRLWVPRSIGGLELPLPESLRVFEAASRLDGSVGCAVTIGTGGGLFAAFLDPDAATEMFGPAEALIAGSGAPSGRAERVEGGYRAEGRWRFASGAHHATWFTANCIVLEDGEPMVDGAGNPLIRAMSFPAEAVTVLDTWHVSGLRATGSHDIEVASTFVPESHTFSVFTDSPREAGPLYRFPFQSIAELSFGAVGLGIARHALDLFVPFAAEKRPAAAGVPLRELPEAQRALGEAEALVTAARALFYETAERAWNETVEGRELTPEAEARVRLAAAHAAASAARSVDLLQRASGMSSAFESSDLGRCWRDVHVLTQHMALSESAYRTAGATFLGVEHD